MATPAKTTPSAGGSRGQEAQRLTITQVAVCKLKPCTDNPRLHSDKQINQIAQSIRTFGFLIPIVVDSELRVIAGHGRALAANQLGMSEVPAIKVEHLTPAQIRAFRIADNRLSENSEWDEKLLGEQLRFLSETELDFDLEATGFEVGEIDLLIEGLAPETVGGIDPADVLPEPASKIPVTREGDLWLLDTHRIFSGNSLDKNAYEALMAGRRAAVVFADAPYNVPITGHATGLGAIQHENFRMASGELSESEFIDFLARAFSLMASHSRPGSLHFVCIDWRHLYEMSVAGRQVFSETKNVCVWVKSNGGMGSLYRSQHELIFVFKNGTEPHRNNVQLGQFGRYRTNVCEYAGANSFSRSTEEGNVLEFHPTTKPVALVGDAIIGLLETWGHRA
jgi:hypothetical protein